MILCHFWGLYYCLKDYKIQFLQNVPNKKMSDESTANSELGLTAQFSWIPRKFAVKSIEELKIFPSNDQTNPDNLALMVRHMNSTFPYYLPSR